MNAVREAPAEFKWLAFLCIFTNITDNISTYLGLTYVTHTLEVNPLAAALFSSVGLVPGLIAEQLVTTVAILWVACSFPVVFKRLYLTLMILACWAATVNNMILFLNE